MYISKVVVKKRYSEKFVNKLCYIRQQLVKSCNFIVWGIYVFDADFIRLNTRHTLNR